MSRGFGQLPGAPSCPFCGGVLDGFAGAQDEAVYPRDGDHSVCIHCTEIVVYSSTPFGFSLRKPTAMEHAQLSVDEHVIQARAMVRAAKAQGLI